MKRNAIHAICEGAVMVALAQILGYLKLWQMPWGGEIVLSMVPLVLYAYRWGLGAGLSASAVFGALQLILAGGISLGWQSMLGDYLIAFGVIGLAAVPRKAKNGLYLGTLLGCGARFLVHYVVGATVWAAYMPETFFGLAMHSPWFYSALYNLAYMLPTTVITLLVFLLLSRPLERYIVVMK